jgi:hypothetical protein
VKPIEASCLLIAVPKPGGLLEGLEPLVMVE